MKCSLRTSAQLPEIKHTSKNKAKFEEPCAEVPKHYLYFSKVVKIQLPIAEAEKLSIIQRVYWEQTAFQVGMSGCARDSQRSPNLQHA